MKNKIFLMIMVIMVCSLTACGQQETGTMTNTGNRMNSIKTAAHLLNWGVGTSMTTDEIKKETV